MSQSVCRFLDWDSRFFGRRIAQAASGTLCPEKIEAIRAWCAGERIDCLFFLAEADDPATTRLAEDHGFRLTDVRVTLEARLGDAPAAESRSGIRPALPEDVPALAALARTSHRDSRFYFDAAFPAELCDALYAAWIENSCRGWADVVLVAQDEAARPVGYVTGHRDGADGGRIGLIAVAPEQQGRGLGGALVQAALAWFAGENRRRVGVVTQGRNVRALRLYARCGFLPVALQLWYHRWFQNHGFENHGFEHAGEAGA